MDGIYSGLRSEDAKLFALVIIGASEHGEKRFPAIGDGIRGSTEKLKRGVVGSQSSRHERAEFGRGRRRIRASGSIG